MKEENGKKPRQIGVTGGIGSGKSVVCAIFRALGAPIYEADTRAKWLVNHDAILRSDITRLLGPQAYDLAGEYNRTWVAARVFARPELLQQLNALIHPRVYADTLAWVREQQGAPYVIKEAALMSAAGDGNSLDRVVVVEAPLDLRLARIRRRDPHRTEDEIRNIISRQISDEARRRLADHLIQNDEIHLLTPQVAALHASFCNL